MEHRLNVNFVLGCHATEMAPMETTWTELRTTFMKIEVENKGTMTLDEYKNAPDAKRKADKDGMAWIPCSTIDSAGRRSQANMDKAYLLVLDIDTGMMLDDVRNRIEGLEAVIHSSFSHTQERPKWRVVLPLASPIPAKDIGKVFDHFQARFDGLLDAACGHDPARLYYVPGCPADAEHLFHYEHLEGAFLDGNVILIVGPSLSPIVATGVAVSSTVPLSLHAGVSKGGRNKAAFVLAAGLYGDGRSIDEVTEAVLAWNEKNNPPLDTKEVGQTVKSAMKTVARKLAATTAQVDVIIDDMNTKYAWIEKQNSIYRFSFRNFVSIELLRQHHANTGIKVRVGDSEKWQTHADVWFRSPMRRAHTDVDFVPGGGAIVDNKVNLWRGWGEVPFAGDIAPWVAFMDFLFAGNPEARKWIEQWLAYPIQHPGAKLTTAVVLWSIKQGVGKSMLGETIGKIYGSHFKTISAVELHASFNGWMRDCQFVLGEENSSSDQRADANKLKAMITGNTIFVNDKYQPALELPNCANFLFTSNHPDAFHLEDADRRFFVWEIVANRMPMEFYQEFVDWRDRLGGQRALMHRLLNIDLTGFEPKGNAPMTDAKLEMIGQSKSEVERWLGETLENEESVLLTFGKQVSCLEEVTETFNRKYRARVNTTAMSRAFRRHHHYVLRRVVTRHDRKKLMSLVNHDAWEMADNAEWAVEFGKSPPVSSLMSF